MKTRNVSAVLLSLVSLVCAGTVGYGLWSNNTATLAARWPVWALAIGAVSSGAAFFFAFHGMWTTHEETQPPRKDGGFSLVEVLVVVGVMSLLIGIMIPALTSAFRSTVVTDADTRSRAALVEAQWAALGVAGPESARVEMCQKIVSNQEASGLVPVGTYAAITDWSASTMAARVPAVVPPADWLSPEALTLMGMAEPVVPHTTQPH